MILKKNRLFYVALLLSLPSALSANITTLQSWDPAPIFNAANLNMPPDTQFCYMIKNRLTSDQDYEKRCKFGINFSPFVQKATRAQQDEDIYFGDSPTPVTAFPGIPSPGTPGGQMSDYQGTPYLMGLFLGQDVNGNSIWGDSTDIDTGIVTDITTTTVGNTLLPTNLKNAINALNNNPNSTTAPEATNYAIIFGTPTNTDNTSPSILSQGVLEQDRVYFGAFSVPLSYQKAGFRWEANFDLSNDIGFLFRGGFCQIIQRVGPAIPLAAVAAPLNTPAGIYNQLNNVSNASTSSSSSSTNYSTPVAQSTYAEWVANNINDLLDTTLGADYNILTFCDTGVEDIQFLGFARHSFLLNPIDMNKYSSVILTPYLLIGCTAPIAPVRDYSKLYALPFGNNGHASVGGVMGLALGFLNRLEFGFEFGATGFIPQIINGLPCPNHDLQRVIYPYRQDVKYRPGFNGQFAAILNAYNFLHNTSFSFKYNFVQHNKDSITLLTPSPYFFPELLENMSTWNSQMFTAALTFELQSSIYISFAWQGALSQKNAYCSNTILGSLNFQF